MQNPLERDLFRYRGLARHITDEAGLKILKELIDDATARLHAGEPPQRFAVALSGGGHRATLFGLGVLLALVDRDLNERVSQIASVSGGSIANAFVAIRGTQSRSGSMCRPISLHPGHIYTTQAIGGKAIRKITHTD
jgi:hypothetical protein